VPTTRLPCPPAYNEIVCYQFVAKLKPESSSRPEKELQLRKLAFAALLCTAAFAFSPAARADGLTTKPGADGAMLIPTYTGTTATVIPVQYWRHHRHWHHRYWRYHRWYYR
jgi:hypothetical protein